MIEMEIRKESPIQRLHRLTDIYGDIPVKSVIKKLSQPKPSWAIVYREWVTDGRGRRMGEIHHDSFTGHWEELEYWLNTDGYELLGWDGPFHQMQEAM
jgi:hypothetical protein